jgi:hypothetical protein
VRLDVENMRRTTLKAALLLSLIGTVGSVLTVAEHARAQDADELADARAKFQRAIELEQGKNWGGALKLFRQVGQVKMTPQVRYHIATCEEKLGQLVAALGGYELALAQSEGMHPDFIAEVQASIDDLKSRVPKLVVERGEGAEAASIQLDGVNLGTSSLGVETPLDPGPHTVTATAPGYEPYQETITMNEGSLEVLKVELVETQVEQSVVVPPPVVKPAEPQKKFGIAPYIIAGSGGALVLTGSVFLIVAVSKHGQAKSLCGNSLSCEGIDAQDQKESKRLSESANTYEALGFVGLGIGIAGVATGAVLYYLDNKNETAMGDERGFRSPTPPSFAFSPAAPSSDIGLSLVGSF